ncbi:UNVERIFIED_CONTAM: hypothetical protein FKN15_076229 [Acipenser sinensis]
MKNSLNPVSEFQSQHPCFRRIWVRIQAAGILEDEGSPIGVLGVILVLAGATLFFAIWKRDLYQAVVSRLRPKLKSSPNTSTSRPGPQDGDSVEQLVDGLCDSAVVSMLRPKLKSSPNTSTSRPGPQDGDSVEQLVDIWKQVEHIEKIFQRQYRVGAQKKKKNS